MSVVAKQVALDNGRAFVITESGRLIEGQLFSGQWRWTFVDLPELPRDQPQAHGLG